MTYDYDNTLLKNSSSSDKQKDVANNKTSKQDKNVQAQDYKDAPTTTTRHQTASATTSTDNSPPHHKSSNGSVKTVVTTSQHVKKSSNGRITVDSSSTTSKSSSSTRRQPSTTIRHRPNGTVVIRSPQDHVVEETPKLQIYFTYLVYYVLELFGHFREFIRHVGLEKRKGAVDNNTKDFAPLFNSYESFHTINVYVRNRDCFNRPVCSVPGAEIELMERTSDDYNWTYNITGRKIKALNLGSYNYLGFAENSGESSKAAIKAVEESGVSTSSPCTELGNLRAHRDLEKLLAQFLRVEDSIVFGMGFATNALNVPALLTSNDGTAKHSLIISDQLNHTSLILGARLSGATIKTFKHNDVSSLEKVLRTSIIEGHPKTRRPWKKILIIVEGVYSMEGTITPLPEIIALKKKYKAYLYLDEAHSIGAVGPTGRGIVEHFGCDPRDVDVLMGTFSKSFGAAGGYLAGSRELITYIRQNSHASIYATSMSPPVCAQIHRTLETIMGLDGTQEGQRRIRQLAENTKYFRDKLKKMGFIVYGSPISPVVPAMLYMPTKVAYFNRMMLERGIAVVTVGFPATNLPGGRVRFCLSAAHTREMLDYALEAIDHCGHMNGVKISKIHPAKSFKDVQHLDSISMLSQSQSAPNLNHISSSTSTFE